MYDDFAKAFARTRNRNWPDIEEAIKFLYSDVNFSLGKVLDIGCGSGRLAGILQNFDEYHGTDISNELLQIAQKNFPKMNFFIGDMREISSWSLTPVDTIFLVASFHHILTPEEQKQVLIEVKKLLVPTGKIVLLNWNLRNEKNSKKYADNWISSAIMDIPFAGHSRHYYAFTLEELEELYKQCGFKILHHTISGTTDNFISILGV